MRAFALLPTLTTPLASQAPLHQQIAGIAKSAKGAVHVACSLPGTKLDCGSPAIYAAAAQPAATETGTLQR